MQEMPELFMKTADTIAGLKVHQIAMQFDEDRWVLPAQPFVFAVAMRIVPSLCRPIEAEEFNRSVSSVERIRCD